MKEGAIDEEASGFDPSGTSGSDFLAPRLEDGREDTESMSARSAQGWRSQTDNTSLSHEMSYFDLEGLDSSDNYPISSGEQSPENDYTVEPDRLDRNEKEEDLMEMFPQLKPFDIRWTLNKCKGDASVAAMELLTVFFQEESGIRRRGIDGFLESEVPSFPPKGKKKGKKKKARTLVDQISNENKSPTPLAESKWDTARQDVEFISNKTRIPTQQITSLYHENGASIPATILAIINAHPPIDIGSDDQLMVQINASELHPDFPTIPISDLEILIRIAEHSLDDARDLATALAARPKTVKQGGIQLELRHTPLRIQTDFTPVKTRMHNSSNANSSLDLASATEKQSALVQARNDAYTKGIAAARRGKSDPLMFSAASHYFNEGRDYDSMAKKAASALADALVSQQSSRTELDLHGVSVKDGVRIAREEVTKWWHEVDETQVRGKGGRPGYRIVVGAGRHSEGGKAKLGPAIGKMLIKEGWKVEVESTAFVVRGVAKRK